MPEREVDVVIGAKDEVSRVFDRFESSSGRTKSSAAAIDTVAASFAKTTMPGQRAGEELKSESPYIHRAAEMSEAGKVYFQYEENEKKLEAMREYNKQYLGLLSDVTGKEIEINKEKTELAMLYASEEQDFKIQTMSQTFGATAAFFQNLYTLSGSHSKKLFKFMKTFNMAQALMDTYTAFNAALKNPPGPPWTIPIAAATLAMGLAKVKSIAATEPGGGAGDAAGGVGGAGVPATSGRGAPPVYGRETEPMQTQNINIQIYNPLSQQNWADIAEKNIIPALKDASSRNIVLNVKTMEA